MALCQARSRCLTITVNKTWIRKEIASYYGSFSLESIKTETNKHWDRKAKV